jgi:glycosyltransferase involved in cell wall biosynthesis
LQLAVAHDYLVAIGGAERVLEVLLRTFEGAPLFTSVYARTRMRELNLATSDIRTSFLQQVVRSKEGAMRVFPLLPMAFQSFDLRGYETIVSSSAGFAHHVRPSPSAFHLCYCYSPPRFLWLQDAYFRDRPALRAALTPALTILRSLDKRASRRVDLYVAISREVARRIGAIYGRRAEVVHPPVDVARFTPTAQRSGRFLVVSRLHPYKRVDVAVTAASRSGIPLDVIGVGPEREHLESLAGPSVRFLGWQPDDVVREAMATCTALILPGAEDFGLTVVEAQASGRPPIAFASGGALETVHDGETGFIFSEQTPEALLHAMRRVMVEEIPVGSLRRSAERFSVAVFQEKMRTLINTRRGA